MVPLKILRQCGGGVSLSLPVCVFLSLYMVVSVCVCVCMLQVEGTLLLSSNPIWLLVRNNLVEKAAMREQNKLSEHFQTTVFLPGWIHSANTCCASPVCQELTVLVAGKTEHDAFRPFAGCPKTSNGPWKWTPMAFMASDLTSHRYKGFWERMAIEWDIPLFMYQDRSIH